MSTPLAPCFKTRLRLHSEAGLNTYVPGSDVITTSPYKAAKEALREIASQNPDDGWLNTRVEVQVVDLEAIGTENPTDLDWDTYLLIARQTLTISDA